MVSKRVRGMSERLWLSLSAGEKLQEDVKHQSCFLLIPRVPNSHWYPVRDLWLNKWITEWLKVETKQHGHSKGARDTFEETKEKKWDRGSQSWVHNGIPQRALKCAVERLPWWSSGQDSMLLIQGPWVQSLVRELGSHLLQLRPGTLK